MRRAALFLLTLLVGLTMTVAPAEAKKPTPVGSVPGITITSVTCDAVTVTVDAPAPFGETSETALAVDYFYVAGSPISASRDTWAAYSYNYPQTITVVAEFAPDVTSIRLTGNYTVYLGTFYPC